MFLYYNAWKNINLEKVTVLQRRNIVNLSTLNQRQKLMLKQCWPWVDSKNTILFVYHDAWKTKIFIFNVERITIFQHWNNVSLSTLNQRWNLTLKHWFWVGSKKQFCSYIILLEKLKSLNQRWNDNCISTSKQLQFINIKSTSKFNIETKGIPFEPPSYFKKN